MTAEGTVPDFVVDDVCTICGYEWDAPPHTDHPEWAAECEEIAHA